MDFSSTKSNNMILIFQYLKTKKKFQKKTETS